MEINKDRLEKASSFILSKSDEIPILEKTFENIQYLYKKNGLDIELEDLEKVILEDPFCSLKVLIKTSRKKLKNNSLLSESDSIKKCLMLVGTREIIEILKSASVCVMNDGLEENLKRANYAALKAYNLSCFRYDLMPDEIELCTLLGDLGELLLWIFAPNIPKIVREAVISGKYKRNKEAQIALCGFGFKDLSIELIKKWKLPSSMIELMLSEENNRAKLSKVCINLSRHIFEESGYLAIPDDILEIKKIVNKDIMDLLKLLDLKEYLTHFKMDYVLNKLQE